MQMKKWLNGGLNKVIEMIILSKTINRVAVSIIQNCCSHNYCAILMFHRVAELDHTRIRSNDHLKVSPRFLDNLICEFKQNGFTFLSMDEVVSNIKARKQFRRSVAITFDDGYQDVFTNGYEVLSAHNVPAMVYVATGLPNGDGLAWWDVLEDYILSHVEVVLPSGQTLPSRTAAEKESAFMKVRDWVFSLPYVNVKHDVGKLCGLTPELEGAYCKRFATDVTLQEFSDDKLISIGCHTHRHVPCGLLSDDAANGDIITSIKKLRRIGLNPRHFAFPYGSDEHNPRRFQSLLEENGIDSCATTFTGVVNAKISNRYFLPRAGVFEYNGFSNKTFASIRWTGIKNHLKGII